MSDDWTDYHEFRKMTDPPPYGQGRDDPSEPRGDTHNRETRLKSKYPDDALGRLERANQAYYSTHGDYVPELAALLLIERAELEASERRREQLEEALDRIAKAHATADHLQEIARAVLAEGERER